MNIKTPNQKSNSLHTTSNGCTVPVPDIPANMVFESSHCLQTCHCTVWFSKISEAVMLVTCISKVSQLRRLSVVLLSHSRRPVR